MSTDISTFDDRGNMAHQTMGSTAGYAEYLAGYEAAKDKGSFNAQFFSHPATPALPTKYRTCKNCGHVNEYRSVCWKCGQAL